MISNNLHWCKCAHLLWIALSNSSHEMPVIIERLSWSSAWQYISSNILDSNPMQVKSISFSFFHLLSTLRQVFFSEKLNNSFLENNGRHQPKRFQDGKMLHINWKLQKVYILADQFGSFKVWGIFYENITLLYVFLTIWIRSLLTF